MNYFWRGVVIFVLLFSSFSPALALERFPLDAEGVTVYDENGNGAPDMSGDVWVFDRDRNGGAELIIRFGDSPLTAYIYDDTNNNGQVDYALTEQGVNILEANWRVKVVARDGSWVLSNGEPNWNLDIEVDSGFQFTGGVASVPRVAACGVLYPTATAIALANRQTTQNHGDSALDGLPDFSMRLWDDNRDGMPDSMWRNVHEGGRFDALVANVNPDLRYRISSRFPLLDTVLLMDWGKARILAVRDLVPSRINEAGYFLLFNDSRRASGINYAFENPFAFYDLAGDRDCVAELKLRTVTVDYDRRVDSLVSYNEIRYSWAQFDNAINYRLYLIGQVFFNQPQPYAQYNVTHVPYSRLPQFVRDSVWRGAAFAEAEVPISQGFMEGLYENLFYTPALRAVLLSRRGFDLPERYLPAYLGLREEYDLTTFNRVPRLYFSTIDRRLHLEGARRGVVIFAADQTDALPGFDFNRDHLRLGTLPLYRHTEYYDSNGDGFADVWTYHENDRVVSQLAVRPGVALFSVGSTVYVKTLPADFRFVEWRAAPPATTAEWQVLQSRLAPTLANRRALNDLQGIFADLPGDILSLPNARVAQISANESALLAEFVTTGIDNFPGGAPLPAGRYVLRFEAGRMWVETLNLSTINIADLRVAPAEPQSTLAFRLVNSGNRDVEVNLLVQDFSTLIDSTTLLEETTLIPASGFRDFSLPYAPAIAGSHSVQVTTSPLEGADPTAATAQASLNLATAGQPLAADAMYLDSHYVLTSLFILFSLVTLLLIGSWLVARTLEHDDDLGID
jgi:hypothetical protein